MASNQRTLTKDTTAADAALANPHKEAGEPQHARRVHIAVPVKVFANIKTTDFQTCCTYEISLTGVRLVAPQGIKELGQVIVLQRHTRRARYKVIWIGAPKSPEAGQVGVECLEPNNVIWENEIKARIAQSD
jgi:hypothetical protein